MSLADVYDALTSERCYKKAFTHEQAVEMICNGECGSFNPLLLECMLEISDNLKTDINGNPRGLDDKRELQKLTDEIIKGLCGNLSLTRLFELFAEQVALMRANEWNKAVGMMPEISKLYILIRRSFCSMREIPRSGMSLMCSRALMKTEALSSIFSAEI